MAPTPEQEAQIERLYENEAIIDNLTSEVAQAILQWAEQQIQDGKDAQAVVAAVSEANRSGAADADAALTAAKQALGPTPEAQAPPASASTASAAAPPAGNPPSDSTPKTAPDSRAEAPAQAAPAEQPAAATRPPAGDQAAAPAEQPRQEKKDTVPAQAAQPAQPSVPNHAPATGRTTAPAKQPRQEKKDKKDTARKSNRRSIRRLSQWLKRKRSS